MIFDEVSTHATNITTLQNSTVKGVSLIQINKTVNAGGDVTITTGDIDTAFKNTTGIATNRIVGKFVAGARTTGTWNAKPWLFWNNSNGLFTIHNGGSANDTFACCFIVLYK